MQRNPPSGAVINLASYPTPSEAPEIAGAATVDWSKGPAQARTLIEDTAITSVGLPAGEAVGGLTLKLIQGPATPPPRGVLLVGAKTPGGQQINLSNAAGAVDIVSLFWDGSQLYAHLLGTEWGP